MSNTLFRKGLVAAAIVALGSAGVAAVPAQAASVLFAPTTGTGNTLVAGETFSLTASLSSDLPASNSTQLKFKVTNTTGVAATVKLNGNTILADGAVTGSGVNEVAYATTGHTAPSALGASTASAVFGIGTANADASANNAAAAASASQATNPTSIQITSAANTTASYTVTAWLDANNNGTVDTGEISADQTVNFVKIADAGSVVTFTKPVLSSANLKATVAFASSINVAQLTSTKYKVGFGVYTTAGEKTATGNAGAAIASANLSTASVATAGDAFFTSTATAANGPAGVSALPVAGGTYAAQLWSNVADGSTWAAVGTEATQVVAASADADNTALTVAPTISDNVIAGDTAIFGTTGVYSVRTGTLSTAVKTTVKLTPAGGTATAVGAGVPVTVTVSGLTLGHNSANTVNDTLTVAGSAVTAANASTFSATVTTAADGTVTVPVVAGYGYANTAITVTLRVPNAGSSATGSASLAWADSAAPSFSRISVGSSDLTIVKGGQIKLQYALKDSYNALYTGTDYQLVVSAAGTGTGSTTNGVYVPVVNGIANVVVADGSTAAGTDTVTVGYQTKGTNGIWSATTSIGTVNVNVIAAAQTASAVSAAVNAAANKGSASDKLLPLDVAGTYVTGNTATAANTVTAPTYTLNSSTTITGTVTDASGVAVANAPVTISLAGAQLSAGTAYGVGALTVAADNSGAYTVTVATHTAGTQTVTVTSGAATKTVSLYVAAAGIATGSVVTITAPTTATPGQTIAFSAKVVDKFGNPVAVAYSATATDPLFTVKATGLGIATNANSADATGTGSGTVTVGSSDLGTITITATYDADGSTTTIAPVVATATIKVAAPAAAAATVTASLPQAQVGSAVDIAVATGVAGVTVSFTNAGTAYLSAASAVTDAKGNASVKLVGNVAGLNTVTATANGAAAKTATVAFGQSDANLTASGKTVTAAWNFAGGKKVVVAVNGKTVKKIIASDDTADSYTFKLAKGTNKVTVSVAGVVTDSLTVKVKK
jgi:adhesin/invasin